MIARLLRATVFIVVYMFVWSIIARWLSSEAMAPTRDDHRYILTLTGYGFGAAIFAIAESVWEAAKRRRGGGSPGA
jgi:hypothetical protein